MTSTIRIVSCIRASLSAIAAPRFFETERGYQGALLAQLSRRLRLLAPEIVEQEYQKRLQEHGLTIRPDIIIHEPFDPARHAARSRGNRAVIELKLNATPDEAADDFANLAAMICGLRYPLGVFVNIGSTATYASRVPKRVRTRVVTFAVSLREGKVHLVEK